ncbi:MAG: hypothetical protein M0Q53_04015 [Prolixibacteraceae bacterium]|jgi:hypothetical protein|nr:hypothetical protein [Prolixibacteraceae bacterium]
MDIRMDIVSMQMIVEMIKKVNLDINLDMMSRLMINDMIQWVYKDEVS